MSECYVSAEDYRVHFKNEPARVVDVAVWSGVERRTGPKDRRTTQHERRWEASRGRRFRLKDRRKA